MQGVADDEVPQRRSLGRVVVGAETCSKRTREIGESIKKLPRSHWERNDSRSDLVPGDYQNPDAADLELDLELEAPRDECVAQGCD